MKKHIASAGFTIIELMIASTIFTFLVLLIVTTSIAVSQDLHKAVWSSDVQSDGRFTSDQIALPIQLSGQKVVLGNGGNDWTQPPNGHVLLFPYDTLQLYSLCVGNVRFTWTNGLTSAVATPPPGYSHTSHLIRNVLWKDTITQGSTAECRPADITQPDPDCTNNCGTLLPSLYDNPTCPVSNPCTYAKDTGIPLIKYTHGLKSLHVTASSDQRLYQIKMELYYGGDDLLIRSSSTSDENIQTCRPISQGGAFCGITTLNTSVYRRLQ